MNRLWSPWRSKHLSTFGTHPSPEDVPRSVFTRMAETPEHDEHNLVVWRGQLWFAVMNLYPYNNGHVLLVPFRQVAHYTDLTPDEHHAMAEAIACVMRWQTEAFQPEGFNVGINVGEAGGAGIPEHLHVHVVPRWAADTNFTASTADLKVIPEALEESYRKLRAVCQAEVSNERRTRSE